MIVIITITTVVLVTTIVLAAWQASHSNVWYAAVLHFLQLRISALRASSGSRDKLINTVKPNEEIKFESNSLGLDSVHQFITATKSSR